MVVSFHESQGWLRVAVSEECAGEVFGERPHPSFQCLCPLPLNKMWAGRLMYLRHCLVSLGHPGHEVSEVRTDRKVMRRGKCPVLVEGAARIRSMSLFSRQERRHKVPLPEHVWVQLLPTTCT